MVFWIILAVLAALIFGLCMIPVGFDADFTAGHFTLSAKLCGFKAMQVFPRAKAAPKEEKPPEEPKEEPPAEEKPQKPKKKRRLPKLTLIMSNEELFALVKKLPEGLGKLLGGFRVDRFLLHYLAAGDDPYTTAVIFGYVNACLSALAPICAMRFPCKKVDVRTAVDFTQTDMQLDFGLAMSLRIGSVFAMINTILFGILGIFLRNQIRLFWCMHFNQKAYSELLLDESAATRLLRSLMEKKAAAEPTAETTTETTPIDNITDKAGNPEDTSGAGNRNNHERNTDDGQ